MKSILIALGIGVALMSPNAQTRFVGTEPTQVDTLTEIVENTTETPLETPNTSVETETAVPSFTKETYIYVEDANERTELTLVSEDTYEMSLYDIDYELKFGGKYKVVDSDGIYKTVELLTFMRDGVDVSEQVKNELGNDFTFYLSYDGKLNLSSQEINTEPTDDKQLHFKSEWAENLWRFLNAPLPIVGVSLIVIGSFALTIFLKSSWGKKAIRKLTGDFDRTEKTAKKYYEKTDDRVKELEAKIDELENKLDEKDDVIIEICSNIRNSNIQKIKEGLEYGKERKETANTETKEE